MRLDHIAVAAETLADGAASVEAALGVALQPGGAHGLMGTHNRLLSLGPAEYLEVIAIDPAARKPAHPRWFGLDGFSGPPRLSNWICAVDDLDTAIAALPGSGAGLALARGDLNWRMAVPAGGVLPFDGMQPALIEWQGTAHPAARLVDRGCRLVRLSVVHPEAAALARLLAPMLGDPRVSFVPGDRASIVAEIETPQGLRVLA
jgi:hypothetical protein